MAIDSLQKRESSLIDPWALVTPDGAITQEDRQALLGQYAGILTPATEESSSAIVSAPSEVGFRLYNSSGLRKYLPERWIGQVRFELLERGGYGSGEMQVLAGWDDLDLAGTERMDVYLYGELAYRGWLRVTQKDILPDGEQQVFTLYGLMERAENWIVRRAFAYSTAQDLSVFAEALINTYARIAGRYPSMTTSITATGVTLKTFDARGDSLRRALDRLCDYAPNAALWRFDTDTGGQDRFVFGPVPAATGYKYGVGGKVEAFVYPQDVSAIVNRLLLSGGTVESPNLITNGSFEEQGPGSDTTGNYLLNSGFEDNSNTAWTLAGGATIRLQGEPEAAGSSRGGKRWLEIDTNGETGKQTVYIIAGGSYTASCWARREDPDEANTFQLTLEGLDAGGGVVTLVYTGAQDPGATGAYKYYSVTQDWSAYPTVERARVTLESFGGTASQDGILIEDVALHDSTRGAAKSWRLNVNGNARFAGVDFQCTAPSPYHGAYCLKLQATNISVASDYLEIWQGRDDYISVDPNERYTFGFVWQTNGEGSASLKVGVQEYQSDYTAGTQTLSALAVGDYSAWQFGFVDFMTGDNTAYLQPFARLYTNGSAYLDAFFICRGEIPAEVRENGGYWSGATYERTVDVEDTFLTGLEAGVASSITNYGEREGSASVEEVTDYTSMIAYASGYFNAHALPKVQAQLRLFDAQALLKPDAKVKLLNLPSAPAALFPAVVRYTIGESIDIDADLGNERPEMVSLMGLIAKKP